MRGVPTETLKQPHLISTCLSWSIHAYRHAYKTCLSTSLHTCSQTCPKRCLHICLLHICLYICFLHTGRQSSPRWRLEHRRQPCAESASFFPFHEHFGALLTLDCRGLGRAARRSSSNNDALTARCQLVTDACPNKYRRTPTYLVAAPTLVRLFRKINLSYYVWLQGVMGARTGIAPS